MHSRQFLGAQMSLRQLTLLSSLITCLREHISWHQDYTAMDGAPWALPVPVIDFCADALVVSPATIENVWGELRDSLWTPDGSDTKDETSALVRDGHLLNIFLAHGTKYRLGALYSGYILCRLLIMFNHTPGLHSILPPTRVCIDHKRCDRVLPDGTRFPQALSKPQSYEATLFTKDLGPIPAWSQSSSCRSTYAL